MTTAAAARRRRLAAAERFRPDVVDTLLVAEAPPSALDRYFYFEDVETHDSLFRYVARAFLGGRPTRDKLPYLEELRERGVFLIDLSLDPFVSRRDVLAACVPDVIRRCRRLAARRILLVGVAVYDVAFAPMRDAGLPVVDARVPYPGSGQQNRFAEEFGEALRRPPE